MFNHTNTPSYFIKNTRINSSTFNPEITSSTEHEQVQSVCFSKSTTTDCDSEKSPDECKDTYKGYKSVSVATSWSWEDIFKTINTTDEAGEDKLQKG